jgi:hypothetical protein
MGDLYCAFPLYGLMVPSPAFAVVADSERMSCGGFSLNKTIPFASLEFIADCFVGLSFSPTRDGSDAVVMGSTHSGPPSPLRAMIGDSTEEFHMASYGEGGIDLPSPRRHDTGASPAPAISISWPEDTPNTHATVMIPQWSDTDLPFKRRCAHQEGK